MLVRTGSGSTFKIEVHDNLTVNALHAKISKLLGPVECPLYAIRLVYKSKVLSMSPESSLSSFGIERYGDPADHVLQLVVVRAAARRTVPCAHRVGQPAATCAARDAPAARLLGCAACGTAWPGHAFFGAAGSMAHRAAPMPR